MPIFTENKTDRAYESFMRHVPNFSRDPPEAITIQKDIDNSQKQKGEQQNDKSEQTHPRLQGHEQRRFLEPCSGSQGRLRTGPRYTDLDELTAFIDEKGRNFADPAAKAKAIQIAARNSYRLPITVNNSVNQAMSVCIATMRALEKQIKVLDKQIEQIFAIIPNTLTSVPGIGKVYSAGIIAEIGDINRFQSQASVAKYAGLIWKQHQSGEFEAQNTRLIKSGNRFLRYYLLEAANSVRRCDSEFKSSLLANSTLYITSNSKRSISTSTNAHSL